MEIDRKRKLIIGVARSPPRRRGPDELPGDRPARREEPQPEVQVGLLRHLLQEPAQARADRRARRGPRGPHDELHRRLPLRVDRRPGAPRRPRVPRAVHARRARGRAADLGHGPPRPGAPAGVQEPDRPEAQRRADRLLARRRRRRPRVRVGQRARRAARLRDQGPLARPEDRPRPRGAPVGSDPGRRRRHPGRRRRRRPAGDRLHPQRDAAGRRRRASARRPQGQRGADDRGGLHGALRPGRPDRRRGHHELDRRGGRDQLDARAPVPDDRARLVPPGAQRGGLVGADHVVLGALLRAPGVDAGGRLVRRRAARDRRVERAQPAPGGLLLRHRHGRGDEPELAVVGHRVAREPGLPVRHGPRHRGAAAQGRPPRGGEARHRARAATHGVDRLAKVPVSGLTPGSLVCPLFARQ